MGYGDLGCYGQKYIQMPDIDRMAAEGMHDGAAYGAHPCTWKQGILAGSSNCKEWN